MRQLERVAASKIGALLVGEANVTATAEKYQTLVNSYYTKTPSIYYHYTEEEEETDSDGNSSWRTIDSRTESVDFTIKDETGSALINRSATGIDWSLPRSFQVTRGNRRYTEWRLEPDNRVFIFGMAEIIENQTHINFTASGQYTAIISKYSESEERSGMGVMSIVQIWAGITLMSLSIYFIAYLVRMHRLVAYLSILNIALSVILSDMGMGMMREDIESGLQRYKQQLLAATKRTENLLESDGIKFYGWHDLHELNNSRYQNLQQDSTVKIREIRLNLLLAREQLLIDMRAMPERWFVGLWQLNEPKILPAPVATLNEVDKRLEKFIPGQLSKFWPGLFVSIGIVLTGVFLWFGIRQVKLKRYVENVPTTSTSGVAYGVCELKGKLVLENNEGLLKSPLTHSDCSWYYYHEEERRGSGKRASWVTIKEMTVTNKFFCEDRDGKIQIDANMAEVISRHEKVKRSGSMRYTEKVLKIDDPLYVIGNANLSEFLSDKLTISFSNELEPFIISNYTEQEVMIKKARKGIFNLNLAFSTVVLSSLLLFGMSGGFAPTDYLMSALIAPVFMMIVMFVLHYNDIIFLKQRAERNWANIKVSLKKRFELIPNIEQIVKDHAEHEAELLERITDFRSQFRQAINNAYELDKLIEQQNKAKLGFSALREKYPELKNNELVNKMIDILSVLENELMYMRRGYNDAVEVYNTRIKTVPDIIFTGLVGFKERDYIAE